MSFECGWSLTKNLPFVPAVLLLKLDHKMSICFWWNQDLFIALSNSLNLSYFHTTASFKI
jgi:hypothetical protein